MWPELHKQCIKATDLSDIASLVQTEGTDCQTPNGSSALHFACIADNFPAVKLLVESGASVNSLNKNGETPLHFAAKQASLELISYLLANNADPTLRDSEQNTPLHWAVEDRPKNVIELLIQATPCIKTRNVHGRTALETAILFGNHAAVIALAAERDTNTLAFAVECQQADIVQVLLVQGANADAIGTNGKTAYQLAKEIGNTSITKNLSLFRSQSQTRKPKSKSIVQVLPSSVRNLVYSQL